MVLNTVSIILDNGFMARGSSAEPNDQLRPDGKMPVGRTSRPM
jgi:hypothetical protein